MDLAGYYDFSRPVAPTEVVDAASSVLEQKIAGDALCSPRDTKEYLRLRLASYKREVFAYLYLDDRHPVIRFEELFHGTIDGASVHPREVMKAACPSTTPPP